MKVHMIGLGKMGLNISRNMKRNGIDVLGFDIDETICEAANKEGIPTADSLDSLLDPNERNIVWTMLPAGSITDAMIEKLAQQLKPGDIVIDGGNSNYKDSLRHYDLLKEKGIYFLDAGTSGGMHGALYGANYMVGGDQEAFDLVEEIFQKTAAPDGYLYTGEAGSGHYLKMVHNGIEYGMMQAIAEGFDVLEHSRYDYDNAKVAKLWNHGSVIRSWLVELMEEAFQEDPKLDHVKGVMFSSGEGQWTIEEALELKVPVPVIAMAQMMRNRSLENDTFTGKVVASMRKGFGGHKIIKGDQQHE
ncbi:phosphogluconate dehydrogenase (NAD(+)-dependent, decarboxylating) [Dubosiella newyorkensis]|mgnify:CR=1 FL=1|uniref:phosphogluconate dehydrogenase (NAD(+)-dependent, decarboxylating) n=1 Tax=Dubosiella newyorkensis TaxID=1862672 RepID=UPI00257354A3|nr:decarboxylating 6-phosphogluconate dehydrogenase [Dubosiella newyorkensis]